MGSITVQQSRLRTTGPGDGQYHSPAVQTQDHRTGLWAVSQSSSPDSGPQDQVVGSITIQRSRLRTTGPGCGQYHSVAMHVPRRCARVNGEGFALIPTDSHMWSNHYHIRHPCSTPTLSLTLGHSHMWSNHYHIRHLCSTLTLLLTLGHSHMWSNHNHMPHPYSTLTISLTPGHSHMWSNHIRHPYSAATLSLTL